MTPVQGTPLWKLLISPLAGEMSGRTEGGAVPPTSQPVKGACLDRVASEQADTRKLAILHTPLWPAGHLPRKGGDRISRRFSPIPKESCAMWQIAPHEGQP
ncbi:hypothetical protein EOA13_00585 [Mesorhizobium sp. M7A.F.Ca.US.011.01.1.1]|nr:hypothetical protein EOA13_00585 [Mesorhizobium sp. M7A.F.Ca.US.011.01.1.1]